MHSWVAMVRALDAVVCISCSICLAMVARLSPCSSPAETIRAMDCWVVSVMPLTRTPPRSFAVLISSGLWTAWRL